MPGTTQKFRFHGTGGSLLGLLIVNGLLTAVTLGIYSFWARIKVRRYLYANTELSGDRFVFHGTGIELLKGWLKAMALIGALILVYVLALVATGSLNAAQPTLMQMVINLVFMIGFMAFMALAINGARRYRLSRSSWRGIRFSFAGEWQEFLKLFLSGVLLTIVTLSLYAPYFRNKNRAFLVQHARFGSMEFEYDGEGKDLFGKYLFALLLTIPTLGLIWCWYQAYEHRYVWSHTTIGPARFRSSVTGGELLGLAVTNLLLVVLTLGIGTTWAMTRWYRFLSDTLELEGDIEWKEIEQRAQFSSSIAEGLAQGLNVDVDMGLGM